MSQWLISVICVRGVESVYHLLLHCGISMALCVFFSCIGLVWVMPKQVLDLFTCWRGMHGSLQSVVVWKMIQSCLMWCLWRKRNDRSFKDRERTMVELVFLLQYFLQPTALDYHNLPNFFDFLSRSHQVYFLYTSWVLRQHCCAFLTIFAFSKGGHLWEFLQC